MKKDTNIIGTEFVMNSGKTIKIISRLDNKKCSIVFIESGEIRENVLVKMGYTL